MISSESEMMIAHFKQKRLKMKIRVFEAFAGYGSQAMALNRLQKDFPNFEYEVVGNCEYGLILYRDKLPKFNNEGRMIFNCFEWGIDTESPKIHPTQKPVPLLKRLIQIFTDEGDVVIDPCAGSGSSLRAAAQCGRKAYGFEIKKDFVKKSREKMLQNIQCDLF